MRLGPAPARESYLLGHKILEVAKETGAQAIHPGYGFLSENAGFATECQKNGVTFIGPPASSIVSMGDKSESKRIMLAAGVPCVPGYHGENQDEQFLLEQAREIGFPLLVKAVMGGGGKGMKLVQNEAEFLEQLASAKREAMSAVGDDVVLLERYITRPRHIELQVFGDTLGGCVHLFERDCSIQRRYQKVLEEAPAPGLSSALRSKMGGSAVDAARAVKYEGAGTVEFIFDRDTDDFYFMEMNTRLQVEHPVTEMITGQDLVEWQLRVASGYPLPLSQEELDARGPHGHAFEARVYAEDPKQNFIPQTGTIHYLRQPEGDGIRVDTGIVEGDTVTPYYDPMISKLVVWDVNRTEALRKLHRALESYHIAGLNNNIPFLLRCSSHKAFREADLDTQFIPKYHDELFAEDVSDPVRDRQGIVLAAACAALGQTSVSLNSTPFGNERNAGFRINASESDMPHMTVMLDEILVKVHVLSMSSVRLTLDDGSCSNVSVDFRGDGRVTATVDGNVSDFNICLTDTEVNVWSGPNRWVYSLPAPEWAAGSDVALTAGSLVAPMPGRITKLLVKVGDVVTAGQPLIVLEAMKMEHSVRAPEDGTVSAINYAVGELCEGSAVLAIVE